MFRDGFLGAVKDLLSVPFDMFRQGDYLMGTLLSLLYLLGGVAIVGAGYLVKEFIGDIRHTYKEPDGTTMRVYAKEQSVLHRLSDRRAKQAYFKEQVICNIKITEEKSTTLIPINTGNGTTIYSPVTSTYEVFNETSRTPFNKASADDRVEIQKMAGYLRKYNINPKMEF